MRVPPSILAVAAVALLLPGASPAAASPAEKPFPTARSVILNEDKAVYTVEGRIRIPKGVEITVQKDVKVIAKGSDPAVIEVEGALDTQGVMDREVIFENVTVELCPEFKDIATSQTFFRGGGVRSASGKAVEGKVFLELTDFSRGAAFDVVMGSGSLELSSLCSDVPIRIRGEVPEGARECRVRFHVRGCGQGTRARCANHGSRVGLAGGLEVDGGDDVVIKSTRTAGALTAVRNWGRRMILDAMKLNSERLEITHREAGRMARAQVTNLDVYSGTVLVSAPPKEGTRDLLVMDRCWFKGLEDPKEILAKVIRDGGDDPANAARVSLPKVDARAHELAGELDR